MKRIVISFITLAALCGVASADRGHRQGDRGHGDRGGRWDRGHSHGHGGARWNGGVRWSGGVRVNAPRVVVHQPRRVYVQRQHVVRRPVYVSAPRIQYRYYDYYQRPTVLAENYQPMAGYYWVAGAWSWNGYEWIWTAGHYEPDPNYVEPSYYDGYNSY